ncbi:MAG: hypothetical protein SVW57_09700 [Thermodesulfobacteriota bacterium]|nr:hypothetical protein [Thermodesulfobacteriota bacterium]
MFKYIVLAVLVYIVYKLLSSDAGKSDRKESVLYPDDELVKDVECNVYIPKRNAIARKAGDTTLYFCSEACAKKYLEKDLSQRR